MTLRRQSSRRGSVVLVALCFVAIIGIALASYMAISSRALTLSNRNAQRNLSASLAELGLEEGLRAFNANVLSGPDTTAALADWSSGGTSVNWTLDTTNKRATASFTFPAGKFGQGATAAVSVRVDNYDATQLDAAWSSSTNYRIGNVVARSGQWYAANTYSNNKDPATTAGTSYWMREQGMANITSAGLTSAGRLHWVSGTYFPLGSLVLRDGVTYRASVAHTASTSNAPPSSSWVTVPYLTSGSDLQYANESMVYWTNATWYRYFSGSWYTTGSGMPPRWRWATGIDYYVGDFVLVTTTWYRCISAHNSSSYSYTNPTYWSPVTTFTTDTAAANWTWSSSRVYNAGDAVYHTGTSSWYRARIGNTNQTPSASSAYWSASPLLSQEWDSHFQYNQYDTVWYNGLWYLSLASSNYGQNPATATSYWVSTANAAYRWSSTGTYAVGNYRSYGGAWYRCTAANTGVSPNSTASWTPAWLNSRGATTGTPVLYAQASVTLGDGSAPLRTQLRASLLPAPLFPNALGATGTLTLSGANTAVTSYNSIADPTAASPTDDAVLAAGSTSDTYALQLGGSNIVVRGYLAAAPSANSPYDPRASYATNATVTQTNGTVISAAGSYPNVDLTRLSRSPYVPKFDIQTQPNFPYSMSNPSGIVTLGAPGASTPLYVNRNGNLNLNSSGDILLIIGPVVIDVRDDLLISHASAQIIIAETGSLRLHVGGQIQIGGGGINNQTLDPKKCIILGTATSGTHDFSTTTPLHGVIYLPGEDIELDASGGTLNGAVSARNITVSGTMTIRYDTSLRYTRIPGVDNPYMIGEWRELNPATEAATMP